MGRLGQLRLLLWKNLKLRQRRPILTVAQIAWPLLIFVATVVLRAAYPPKDVQECRYNARAMPSAGILPFMQSMVCDLESSCVNTSLPDGNDVPTLAESQVGRALQDLGPVLQNDTLLNYVLTLPANLEPIKELTEVVESTVRDIEDNQPRVADLFHDVEGTKSALIESHISRKAVDAIFNSTVNTFEEEKHFARMGPICPNLSCDPNGYTRKHNNHGIHCLSKARRTNCVNCLPLAYILQRADNEEAGGGGCSKQYASPYLSHITPDSSLHYPGRYNARAMPSAGILPFMQSMVCDLESSCVNTSLPDGNDVPTLAESQVGRALQDLGPVLQNDTLLNYVLTLPANLEPIKELTEVVESTVRDIEDNQPRVADLFHDVEGTKSALIESHISRKAVDAIFNSTVNTFEVLDLFGSLDAADHLCNETALQDFLQFPPGANVSAVSTALCRLSEEERLAIVARLPRNVNVTHIQQEFQNFSDAVESYSLEVFLEDIEELQAALKDMDELKDLVQALPPILRLADLGPLIGQMFGELQEDGRDMLINRLLDVFGGLEESYFENDYGWRNFKRMIINARKLAKGEDFVLYYDIYVPLDAILKDSDALAEQLLSEDLNLTREDVDNLFSSRIYSYSADDFNQTLEYPEWYHCWYGRDHYFFNGPTYAADINFNLRSLCPNFTAIVNLLKPHVDLISLNDQLDKKHDEFENTTIDYKAVASEAINLIDQVRRMDYRTLFDIARNIFEYGERGWLGTLEPWLAILVNTTEDLLDGDGNKTAGEHGLPYWLSPLLTAAQMQLIQYPGYPHIHQQLVIQYLTLQLEIDIVNMFTGSCPDGWQGNSQSCYRYDHTTATYDESLTICTDLHGLSHPVTVNTGREQEFLERIGEDSLVWLGVDASTGYWIDDVLPGYAKRASDDIRDTCAAANFGSGGSWRNVPCTDLADSLCEFPQEHALVTLIKNSPHTNLTDLFSRIGPNATEVFIRETLSLSTIEALIFVELNGTSTSHTSLCTESFLNAIGPVVSGDLLSEVCAFDPVAFWEAQVEYWSFPDLQDQVGELVSFSSSYPTADLLAEYQYVDISAVVSKQLELQGVFEDLQPGPLDFQDLLDPMGPWSPEEWAGVLERLGGYWNEQTMQMAFQLSNGSLLHNLPEEILADPLVQQQLAYQHLGLLVAEAGNAVYEILADLSDGSISVTEPEMQKFLSGMKELLTQGSDVESAILGVLMDNEKLSMLSYVTVEELLCTSEVREVFFNITSMTEAALDGLCAVDYRELAQEVSNLLGVPAIEELVNSYILGTSYTELLEIPDLMKTQETWAELIENIMNIDEVLQAYDSTYNLDLKVISEAVSSPASLVKAFDEVSPILADITPFDLYFRNLLLGDAFMVVLGSSLEMFTGEHITLPDDIGRITRSTEAEKVVPLLYRLPDILRVNLGFSYDQDEIDELLEQFLGAGDSDGLICSEAGLKLMNNSFSEDSDLVGLQADICAIDFIKLFEELNSLPIIESVMTQVFPLLDAYAPLPAVNLTAIITHGNQFSSTLGDFLASPLSISFNQTWVQQVGPESLTVLEDYGAFSSDPRRILEQLNLQSTLQQLEMDNYTRSLLDTATAAVNYLNDILVTLPGENLTLSAIFPPYIARYLEYGVNYGVDINALLLKTFIRNEGIDFLTEGGDFFQLVCGDLSALQSILTVPPEVDLSVAQEIICRFNTMSVALEVRNEIDDILSKAQNGTGSDGFISAINQLIMGINDLTARPPVFTEFNMEWLETTSNKLNAVLIELENSVSSTAIQSMGLEMLYGMFSDIMANDSSTDFVALRLQDYINSLVLDGVNNLIGKNISLATLEQEFTELPTLQDVLALREVIPEMVDAVLALATDQQKLVSFLRSPTPFKTACQKSLFDYYFEVSLNSTSGAGDLEERICGLDETSLFMELDTLLGISQIQQNVNQIVTSDPDLPEFNLTAIFLRDTQLQSAVSELLGNPPTITVDEAFWQEKKRELEAVLTAWEAGLGPNLMNMVSPEYLTRELQVLLFDMFGDPLDNSSSYGSYLTSLRLQDYFTSVILEKTQDLIGKNVSFAALSNELTGQPTLLEVLTLRDLIPEMVDALIALSTNQEKLSSFLSSPTPLLTACQEKTFTYYFGVPEESTTDVEALEGKLCGLTQSAFFMELDTVLGINEIVQQIGRIVTSDPSLPPFNLTAIYTRDEQLQAAIAQLFVDPPTIDGADVRFWQDTRKELEAVLMVWEGELPTNPKYLMTTGNLSSLYATLDEVFAPFVNETWYQQTVVNLRQMDYINSLLEQWAGDIEGQTLTIPTLHELFGDSENIEGILRLADLAPDVIDAFLSLSLQQDMWSEFWAMQYPLQTLCAAGNFSSFFELPTDSQSNITAIENVICSTDLVAIEAELEGVFNLNEITAQLSLIIANDPSLGPYNWTASYLLSMRAQEAIAAVIMDPFQIVVDPAWWQRTRTEILQVLGQYSSTISSDPANPGLDPMLSVEAVLKDVNSYLNRSGILNRVSTGTRITLGHLAAQWAMALSIGHSSLEEVYIYTNTTITPERAAQLLSITPEEIDARLVSEVLNIVGLTNLALTGEWDKNLCNGSYFLRPGINITAVSEYLCRIGPDRFFADLEGLTGFNVLETFAQFYDVTSTGWYQPVLMDWQQLFDLLEETIRLVEEVTAFPQTHLDTGEVEQVLQHLYDAQVAVMKQDARIALSSLKQVLRFFDLDSGIADIIANLTMPEGVVQNILGLSNGSVSALDVCKAAHPVLVQTRIWEYFQLSDDFFKLVDQYFFELPNHEEEIQAILNNHTMLSEFVSTVLSVSTDINAAWQQVSRSYQLHLFYPVPLALLEGSLGDVACDEEAFRSLYGIHEYYNISSLSTLVCSLDMVIQTDLIQELFRVVDISSLIETLEMYSQYYGVPPSSCESLFDNGAEFMNNMGVLLTDPSAFKLDLQLPGLERALLQLLLSSLDNRTLGDHGSVLSLLDVVEGILDGDIDSLNSSVNTLVDELFEQYQYYLDSLEEGKGLVPIQNIWYDPYTVYEVLGDLTFLSPDGIDVLMNGFFNATVLDYGHLNFYNWLDRICEPETFENLILVSPEDSKERLYEEICVRGNKSQIINQLNQAFSFYDFWGEIERSNKLAPGFLVFLGEVGAVLQGANTTYIEDFVITTLPLLSTADDLPDIMELLPNLSNTIELLNSTSELLKQLEPLLAGSPQFQQLKELVDLLIEKEYLLEILEDVPELQLRKSLNNAEGFGNYLKHNFSLSDKVIEDLLDSKVKLETILPFNVSNAKGSFCEEDVFTDYLTFPESTDVTAVVASVCSDNVTTAFWDIVATLASRSNLERALDQFSSADLTQSFTNMTISSLQNISKSVENLQGLEQFPELLERTTSLERLFEDQLLDELANGETSAFTLFQDNPELLCGGKRNALDGRKRRQAETAMSSGDFCEDLYAGVQQGNYGDLRWAYTKPIILGKILYIPDNPVTRQIVMKANKPFQDMMDVRDLATSWLQGAGILTDLISSQGFTDIQNLLGNSFISQLLQSELDVDADSLASAIDGDLATISPENIQRITTLAEVVHNLTSCMELNRFEGFNDLTELEDRADELNIDGQFLAAIQFYGVDDLDDDGTVPKHFKYALRMDTERTPTTRDLLEEYWYPDSRDDYYMQQQYLHGFVFIQDLVERAVIEIHSDDDVDLSSVYVQQMPYPCFKRDRFLLVTTVIFPLLFTIGFLLLIAVMTHQLVYEKERGIEELMKVMGLYGGINWAAWFIINAAILTVIMLIVSILLYIGGLLVYSQWTLVFVMFMCFAFSLLMMSYMVSSFFHKATIASLGGLIVFLFLYLPFGYILVMGGDISFAGSLGVSLASPSAFCFSSLIMIRYEHQGVGALWSNAWDNPRYEDNSKLGACCIMMIVDGFLYFLIGWYIRAVFPGKYGMPRPWYFPFQRSYWQRSDQQKQASGKGSPDSLMITEGIDNPYVIDSPPTSTTDIGSTGTIEEDPVDRPVGISVWNLTKSYPSRCSSEQSCALDKVNLKVYEGQVTALLGSNGAGKTTAISIMTGMFPSTSGLVQIYNRKVGYGNRSNDVGLCPQRNALYDELTVKEHLLIYGRLQGMDTKTIRDHGITLLEELRLMDMISVPVRNLSGGMKRKLCVAIALIGDPRTVILDEPTSGVDPHARRAVWDLIIRNKQNRTILLCTHFMDEADLLGDRIAILDKGRLQCCGSSAFLKSKYTSGVKLTISKELPSGCSTPEQRRRDEALVEEEENADATQKDLCDSSKVTAFLTSKVDRITLIREVGSELVYQLPSSPRSKVNFSQLFRDLDSQLEDLHIRSYGVSDTKLEEVFLKVSTKPDLDRETNVDSLENTTNGGERTGGSQRQEAEHQDGKRSGFQQFMGILIKRFNISRRDWRGLIWSTIMPLIVLILGTLLTLVSRSNIHPQLQLTPSIFRSPNYVFFSNGGTMSYNGELLTEALFSNPGIGTTCMADADQPELYPCTFTEEFFDQPLRDLVIDDRQDIIAADAQAPPCSCEGSRQICPEGSGGKAPPEWTMNTSDILQDTSLKTDLNQYILDTRHRFQTERYGGVSFVDIKDGDINKTVVKAWYSNIGYHALPTFVNVANNILLRASLDEKANSSEYGITAYNYPLEVAKESPDLSGLNLSTAKFGLVVFLMAALVLVPSALATLVVLEDINGAKELHFVSGVSPALYWLTNLLWDWLVYFIVALIMVIILAIFGQEALVGAGNAGPFILLLAVYGFAILSQNYLIAPLFADTGTAFVCYFCLNFVIFIVTILPTLIDYFQLGGVSPGDWIDTVNNVFLAFFTPFCLASAVTDMLYVGVEVSFYAGFGITKEVNALGIVGWYVFAMLVHGILALSALLVWEQGKKKRVKCGSTPGIRDPNYEQEDSDVTEERQRVSLGGAAEDILVLKDVCKVYKMAKRKLTAVDHISFGLPKGECFGLLGVNGAGKTTLFKMITTDKTPSSGSITINSNSIGYCPQVNAIYDQLTGEEILYCYARLKGIKEEGVVSIVEATISQMGMESFAQKVTSTYSGGMKRTLSVAVALLGNPQLVLLDEPTAGMDPVSKQAVWRSIQSTIADGRSVIVTSHGMEECENLCTRLAIMVNGRFRCLGSPQHVKHRYGDGYTVILHLNTSGKSADMGAISQFMDITFPNNVLKEQHLSMLRYQLSGVKGIVLADIYDAIESQRDVLGIEDYSLSQTTLDQVFVNFAKRQKDLANDDASSTSSSQGDERINNPAYDPLTIV